MPIYQAIILGIVQGLSEFLPISSSGHLLLTPWLAGWEELDPSIKKSFDVALHLGTLVAVVGYFRRDVSTYVVEGTKLVFQRKVPPTTEGKLAWLFVLATLPAAAVGALFEDQIDNRLGTPLIIGISLIVFGIVLAIADRSLGRRRVEDFRAKDALLVGAAQALALNPGTSRSGITMTAGRFLGFDRDAAVRISFVMSIPVIFGAVVFKFGGLISDGIPEGFTAPLIAGIISSGLSGWLAVWGTIRIVRTRSFMPFVIYRIVLGVDRGDPRDHRGPLTCVSREIEQAGDALLRGGGDDRSVTFADRHEDHVVDDTGDPCIVGHNHAVGTHLHGEADGDVACERVRQRDHHGPRLGQRCRPCPAGHVELGQHLAGRHALAHDGAVGELGERLLGQRRHWQYDGCRRHRVAGFERSGGDQHRSCRTPTVAFGGDGADLGLHRCCGEPGEYGDDGPVDPGASGEDESGSGRDVHRCLLGSVDDRRESVDADAIDAAA